MTAAEQREVLQRAREAGHWNRGEMMRGWEHAHEDKPDGMTEPNRRVLRYACGVVREVEAFLGERLHDRLWAFTLLILGSAVADECNSGTWWTAPYVRCLTRAFEAMP